MIQNEPRDENKWAGGAAEPEGDAESKVDAAADETAAEAAVPDETAADGSAVDELTGDDRAPEDALADDLRRELDETKERLLRSLADVENMRRRHARELEEARKYAITGFARELLDIADNLHRAIESVPPKAREKIDLIKNLAEGVALTEKMLLASFERHRISKVEPVPGEKFDHNRHQAMFEVQTGEHVPGSVAQVVQPGYVIADRLLRPAMVGVAKAAEAAADPPPGNGADEPAAGEPRGDGGEGDEPASDRPGDRVDTIA